MSRRDIVFLVADSAMEQMLLGFLCRAQFHRSLGCGPFTFDPREDIVVAPTKDPGVFNAARELLRPYENRYLRSVVILDHAWEGSPGAEAIRTRITGALDAGWKQCVVIVIDPELESWVWQDNPHVAKALKCRADIRDVLRHSGHWPDGVRKPPDPKAALDYLRRRHGADWSSAAFRRLAERISVSGCVDPSFVELRDTLRSWFPPTAGYGS